MDLGLFFLALTFALEFVLVAVFLLLAYFFKKEESFFLKFDASYIGPLLRSAWPMTLSALAIVAYMRIDQIMIKHMLDAQSLGLYSSVTRIYEGWIIMFTVVSVSLLPVISKLKSKSVEIYRIKLTHLFSLLIWISIAGALFSTIFRYEIISIIFGPDFLAASRVFSIVMWSAPFAAIGSLTVRYLTIENMERKIAIRTFIALAVNIGLNIILIPLYGIEGAAISTLIALFVGNYLINYFDKELHFLKCVCNNGFMIFLKPRKLEDHV
jgi:O-antigen/teichoic acid export membrane protein